MNEDLHKATEALFIADAKLRAGIARRGEKIAKDNGYSNLVGLDAIYRYLIDKHHWLPSQVRALSTDDLSLLLEGYVSKRK